LAVDLAPYIKGVGVVTGSKSQLIALAGKYSTSEAKMDKQVFALYGQLAGIMRTAAKNLNVDIYWGNDWDNDTNVFDTNFVDLGHFFKKEHHGT